MTRYERYKEQLRKLEEKKSILLRRGRFIDANNLNSDIREIELLIKQAEEYEESKKPRPLQEMVSKKELHKMGIVPLMIECHLIADMLVEVSYMVMDICKKHGFTEVSLMPELKDIIKRANKFSSFLTEMSPELSNLLVRNETLNGSLHKKYLKYIEQRLNPKKKDKKKDK